MSTEKSSKEQLAEGAKKIKAEQAAKKKADAAAAKKLAADAKKAEKKAAKKDKPTPPVIVEPPVKAIIPTKGDIEAILAENCVIRDNFAVELRKGCEPGKVIRITDHFAQMNEVSQLFLGDIYNQLPALLGEKWQAIMAASGRPVGTWKQYGYVASRIPLEMRKLHPVYSHLREIAKIDKPEEKKQVILELNDAQKAGGTVSTADVKKKVKPLAPRKASTRGRKPDQKTGTGKGKGGAGQKPPLEMSAEQQAEYDELFEAASTLEELITGKKLESLRAFLFQIAYREKKALRDLLDPAARLVVNIDKYLGYPNQ